MGFSKRRHGSGNSVNGSSSVSGGGGPGGGGGGGGGKSSKKSSSTSNSAPNDQTHPQPHILLARGLSARYVGANMPLTALKPDEVERDLRHIEAFTNACTAYAQQFYIFTNQGTIDANGVPLDAANSAARHRQPMRNVAMPTRIDPEEDQRLLKLRQTIEHCENQREILESQYLSLRAHYVYMSHVLCNLRDDVNQKVNWLQTLVRQRGRVVGLQRVRLQVARDVLAALEHRRLHGNPPDDPNDKKEAESMGDLLSFWTDLEDELAKAEQVCRAGAGRTETWHASLIPKTPPGVPLRLSQLSKAPDHASAYGTNAMFGSKPTSMCWLVDNMPATKPSVPPPVQRLKEEVTQLQSELDLEREKNRDLHRRIVAKRQRSDELVAVFALLRSETEAIISRHNLLLESATKIKEEEDVVPTTTTVDPPKTSSSLSLGGRNEDGEIAEQSAMKRSVSDDGDRSIKRRKV